MHKIYKVALDDAVLQKLSLKERLLLKLNALPGLVLAHRSITSIFFTNGNSGALVILLADYPNRP